MKYIFVYFSLYGASESHGLFPQGYLNTIYTLKPIALDKWAKLVWSWS